MDQPLFFDGAQDLLRILLITPVIYLAVVAFIRIAGKRSTSQMNNFDWVLTVALGSLASSGILVKDVTALESLLAIGLILVLQWILTRTMRASAGVEQLVKASPALVFERGRFLEEPMRRERLSQGEVLSAIRGAGHSSLDDVRWVILESNASFSVIAESSGEERADAMRNVDRIDTGVG